MSSSRSEFTPAIKRNALSRQMHLCASCGTHIAAVGESGQKVHAFGERAEAHHVIPSRGLHGPATEPNCVILCRSCHLNAHQGGAWRDTSIYLDLHALTMETKIERMAKEYPHYRGLCQDADCLCRMKKSGNSN